MISEKEGGTDDYSVLAESASQTCDAFSAPRVPQAFDFHPYNTSSSP